MWKCGICGEWNSEMDVACVKCDSARGATIPAHQTPKPTTLSPIDPVEHKVEPTPVINAAPIQQPQKVESQVSVAIKSVFNDKTKTLGTSLLFLFIASIFYVIFKVGVLTSDTSNILAMVSFGVTALSSLLFLILSIFAFAGKNKGVLTVSLFILVACYAVDSVTNFVKNQSEFANVGALVFSGVIFVMGIVIAITLSLKKISVSKIILIIFSVLIIIFEIFLLISSITDIGSINALISEDGKIEISKMFLIFYHAIQLIALLIFLIFSVSSKESVASLETLDPEAKKLLDEKAQKEKKDNEQLDNVEMLKKIHELYENGVISRKEYEKKHMKYYKKL